MPRVDVPEEGYYLTRLVRGGPKVPVRIWHGPPPDPDNPGQVLDRSWRWQCLVDNKEADPFEIWPYVAGRRIDRYEYEARLAGKAWDRLYDPGSPFLDPDRPINKLKARIPF
jgi:hypothetical protein